jgi:hypothetical protein
MHLARLLTSRSPGRSRAVAVTTGPSPLSAAFIAVPFRFLSDRETMHAADDQYGFGNLSQS